jgi:purine-binding chemotaxis protein CheW
MAATRQFCSFFVDNVCFGIEVEHIQEISNATAITRVPLAPAVVAGLLNLRGQILTVIDLRRCLNLGGRPDDQQQPVNLILRTADGGVSLLVDRIGDVLDVAAGECELPPGTLNIASREWIRGAYRVGAGMVLALNIASIVNGVAVDASGQRGVVPLPAARNAALVNSGGL